MKTKLLAGFFAFVALALCANIALSAFMLGSQKETARFIADFKTDTEDVDQEDDVLIAGTYKIKSTLAISDAYRSGDTSALSDADKETLDMAKKIIDEIITDGMSDFEKEKAVYDWLTAKLTADTGILTVIPTGNGDNDNPHDVLKYRSAVCVGFATTFRMFMQMFGIECKVIHSSDRTHSWDLIKLDDGWYHTDCYSDNETNNYQNFNMDDNRCEQSHTWTKEYFPAATGKKYNYILTLCETLDNIYAVPKWLANAILKKKNVISCTFKTGITEKNEAAAQYMVEELVNQLDSGENYSFTYEWLQNDKGEYVLCFFITHYNRASDKVDKKTARKIDQLISDAIEYYYNKVAVG